MPDPERPPITRKTAVWRLVMAGVHVLYAVVWPTRVFGRERVPARGRVVLVANHQSYLDIPLIAKAVLRRHVAFVARDTLARSRILAFVMRNTGAILIGRGRGDRAAMRRIAEHLEAEDMVALFPEGTRTPDGRLHAPKKGALVVARQTGAPLLPCAIEGSRRAWPRGRRLPRPGRLVARFGEPVDPSRDDALDAAWRQVAALLGEPAPTSTECPSRDEPSEGSAPGAESASPSLETPG